MYIAIGKIIQTYGIQGYVKAVPYADIPGRFLRLKTIYIKTGREIQGFTVEDVLLQKQVSLIKFKGIESPEGARFLVKQELWVPEEQKIELPENTYFIHDLISLQVFDTTQHYLGEIQDVMQNAGNDIYVVRQNEREILIPAVSQFVKEIDLRSGKMFVQLIEGMLE